MYVHRNSSGYTSLLFLLHFSSYAMTQSKKNSCFIISKTLPRGRVEGGINVLVEDDGQITFIPISDTPVHAGINTSNNNNVQDR